MVVGDAREGQGLAGVVRRVLALGACALCWACAPSARNAVEEPPAARIEVTKHDQLLAKSVLAGEDTALFLNVAQIDSIARALASIRMLGDTAIDEFLAEHPTNYWLETTFISTGLDRPGRDTVRQLIERCASRATPVAPSESMREGYPKFPIDCWPALAAALAPVTDADVRVQSQGDGWYGLTIWTDLPVDRYALTKRLRAHILDGFHGTNSMMNHWPHFALQRLGEKWRFIFARGWMDCVGGCGQWRYYLYRWDPSTERVAKEGECGRPLPLDRNSDSLSPGQDTSTTLCPRGVGHLEWQAKEPTPDP